ncbi:MAG: hypothetical protein RL556_830, partial [Actinomycetota bacterium]
MSQLVWNTTREARSGWYQTTASMHFTVEIPRLYAICDDPASWPLSQPRTRTLIDKDQRLGYAFDNDTKVEIEFAAAARSIARVTVTATHLHNEQELLWAQNYWQTTLERMAKRTSSEPVIAYSAPGKLNLFFKVGPLRQDGYHDVASIYQAVNLRETVIVEHSSKWQVEVTGNLSAEQLEAVPTGEENLVVRAAKAVAAAADIANPIPVHFSINKQVPVAGGMGGGSADAAAAILAVNDLWKANLPAAKLLEIAASIGADVPFALRGGLAIGRGNGDRIEVVKQAGEYHWVLVLDETGLSTPVVFGRLDELRTQA